MLCSICSDMFTRGEKGRGRSGAHHITLHGLQQAAQNRCGMCHILVERIKRQTGDAAERYAADPLRYKFQTDDDIVEETISLDFRGMGKKEFVSIALHKTVSGIADDLIRVGNRCATEIQDPTDEYTKDIIMKTKSTGDPAVLQLAAQWLGNCLQDHNCENDGQKAGWFPDRVLDLTGEGPRLLITLEEKPIYSKYAH